MTIEDRVATLFAEANPVPSLDMLEPLEPVDLDSLEERSERSWEMTEVKRRETSTERRPGTRSPVLLVAMAAVVVATGIGVYMATRGGAPVVATPVDRATAFWTAVEAGDREAALAQVSPEALAADEVNTFGRAHTLDGQFDWYESVGFRWALDRCVEATAEEIECTVTAANDWTDALDVDPVEATYVMEVDEDGVTAIIDPLDRFGMEWSTVAFEVFADWVATNHPDDAELMFNFDLPTDQEILDLYRRNTDRFVEAHTGG